MGSPAWEWCQRRNANTGKNTCTCSGDYTTFVVQNLNGSYGQCVLSQDMRKPGMAGCNMVSRFQGADDRTPLKVLDTEMQTGDEKLVLHNCVVQKKCRIRGLSYLIWSKQWYRTNINPNVKITNGGKSSTGSILNLKWNRRLGHQFSGHILRIDFICPCEDGNTSTTCAIFKAKGTAFYPIIGSSIVAPIMTSKTKESSVSARAVVSVATAAIPKITPSTKTPTTQAVRATQTVTETTTTTEAWQRTSSVATAKPTASDNGAAISHSSAVPTFIINPTTTVTQQIKKFKSKDVSSNAIIVPESTIAASQQTTKQTTIKTTTVKPSSTVVHTKTPTSSVPPTTSETEEPTRETTPDEPEESTAEPTTIADRPGGSNANKGGRNGGDGKDNTVLVAIIAASASVICVAIVSFCAWLIFTQRRKRCRQAERYLVDNEVIVNPMGKNNLPLPSMLKNPVFAESDYLEPCEQPNPSAARAITVGSPVYDTANVPISGLLVKNPLVKGSQQSNCSFPMKTLQKIPNNERSASNENIHDNAVRRSPCEEEKPVYQELTIARPKSGAARQAGDEPVYEAIQSTPAESARPESLYQALVGQDEGQSQKRDDVPGYLAVVPSPDGISESADCSGVQAGRATKQKRRTVPDSPVYDVLEEPEEPCPERKKREEIPEYLAVLASPGGRPESADYDEVQAEGAGKREPRTGHDNPAYDVLEEPEEPDYAELEGPE